MSTRAQIMREIRSVCDKGRMRHFQAASARHSVPIEFLLAVASRESAMGAFFDANPGRNWFGDDGKSWGIMQINVAVPGHARELANRGVTRPTDHAAIIDYGAAHLADLARITGSWFRAFAAYNAGPDCRTDACTTGRDYASDVARRSNMIREELAARSEVCQTSLPVPVTQTRPPDDITLPEEDIGTAIASVSASGSSMPFLWWLPVAIGASLIIVRTVTR